MLFQKSGGRAFSHDPQYYGIQYSLLISYIRSIDGTLRSRSTTPDPLSPERPSPPSPPSYIPPKPPSPTFHQRMKQLGGVATPLAMSSPLRRSNPPTPTQPRRPDFISVAGGNPGGGPRAMFPHYSQFSYEGPLPRQQGNSPQRRFMSESELVIQSSKPGSVDCPPVSSSGYHTMFDNIQELASSPQHSQYNWRESPHSIYNTGPPVYYTQPPKDPSVYYTQTDDQPLYYTTQRGPIYYTERKFHQKQPLPQQQDPRAHHRSNPTSPTQTCPPHYYCPSSQPPAHYYTAPPHHQFHHHHQQQQQQQHHQQNHFIAQIPPQQHGGMMNRRNSGPGYIGPQSPQIRRKNYAASSGLITPPTPTDGGGRPSPIQKRPVSLMRSLELMDNSKDPHSSLHSHHNNSPPTLGQKEDHRLTSPQEMGERRSAYDMNYEISV